MTGPPELYNLDAEQSLVGAGLLAGARVLEDMPVAGRIRPSDFWDAANVAIWAVLRRMVEAGKDIDADTVAHEMDDATLKRVGGIVALQQRMNACLSWPHADTYAQIVLEDSWRRKINGQVVKLGTAVLKGLPSDEELADALEVLDGARRGGAQQGGAHRWQVLGLTEAYTERDPKTYLVEGLLSLPSLTITYGAPGCLKSLLAVDMALCVAAGVPWLIPSPEEEHDTARMTVQVPVLYLDFDNGRRRTEERIAALARARDLDPDTIPFYYVSMGDPWLDASDPAMIETLIELVQELSIGLVVVDNLGVVSGAADENTVEMVPVLANWRRVVEVGGAAVNLIHHQRKATGYKGAAGDLLRGHSSINAAIDLALLVERDEGSDEVTLRSTKTRGADVRPFGALFAYTHQEGTVELGSARFFGVFVEDTTSNHAITQEVLAAVEGEPGINKGTLTKAVKAELPDVGQNRIRRRIEAMVGKGDLVVNKVRNTHHYNLPRKAPPDDEPLPF